MSDVISAPNIQPRPLRLGDRAPDFQARTTKGPVRLSDYRGRWVMLFSHPADFTPVCTTEFVALAKAYEAFEALDCALLGLSVDSLYAHLAWIEAVRVHFGVTISFPLIEDPSMAIARAYGMIEPEDQGSAGVRASFFIDPEGVVRAITSYPMSVGRSVPEMLRIVAALQRTAAGDVLAPADWQPGAPLLRPVSETQEEALAAGENWFCRSVADRA